MYKKGCTINWAVKAERRKPLKETPNSLNPDTASVANYALFFLNEACLVFCHC